LLNVKNNLSAEEIPADTVCFHCQQAVEANDIALKIRDFILEKLKGI
jgi:hypothetical protein